MKRVSATHARNNFSELLSLVAFQNEQFLVQRKGKPIAAIVPPKDVVGQNSTQKASRRSVRQLRRFALGVSDDWKNIEKMLADMHSPIK